MKNQSLLFEQCRGWYANCSFREDDSGKSEPHHGRATNTVRSSLRWYQRPNENMCSEALDQFKNKNSTEFWLEEGKLYECYHSLQRINNGGEIALIRTNKEPLVKRGLYCRKKAALKNLLM